MLSNIKKRKEEGFTIIEVLIVLAIAGLILLVVFLAVPALQRNARNTQRREDVSNIMAGVSEYVSNNNGRLPTGTEGSGNRLTLKGDSGTNTVSVALGYYDAGKVSVTSTVPGDNGTTDDTVVLISGAKCSPDTVGKPISGSSRSIAAIYTLEGSDGGSKQCNES